MSPSKASSLKILCDENIPYKVVELLKSYRFDFTKPPAGTPDLEVAKLAKQHKRILITFDKIFGNIELFPPNHYYGIVLIRIRPPLIETILNALLNLFKIVKVKEFKGKLLTVTAHGFKVYPKA